MKKKDSFSELKDLISLTDVLDNIDVGIIIYNTAGDFLFMNTVMVNWRNIPRPEYLKMNVRDFYDVMDVCVFDLVMKEKKRISRLQYYKDFQKADSVTRTRIVTGTPIFDENGNIKYVLVILQGTEEFENQKLRLMRENKFISDMVLSEKSNVNREIIAKSSEMTTLLESAETISRTDAAVLLSGESGTGKELFARYIHTHSSRRKKPFIAVNCAALPENLIESELFGYEDGSFTGAKRKGKEGLVEAADHGTLFLDEVNSLPLSVQGKILRTIEEKSIRKVGSNETRDIDFRLISATNQNLPDLIGAGSFRADLYYRINVIPLVIPPLRFHRDDIVPLCLHFLYTFSQKYGVKKIFSDDIFPKLKEYDWPGNVRELRNFVERMVVMTPSTVSVINNIPEGTLEKNTSQADDIQTAATDYKKLLSHVTSPAPDYIKLPHVQANPRALPSRQDIANALSVCRTREEAAAYLGVSRRWLQYRIKEYNLSKKRAEK